MPTTTCTANAAGNGVASPDVPAPLTMADVIDATPADRDRQVDFLRACSIVVVVLWHWVFSITQWNDDGSLGMPNPVGDVPGLWLATWLLQIMPLFFVVGGFANMASLEALELQGLGAGWFARSRAARLVKPVSMLVAVWASIDIAGRVLVPGHTSVLQWGMVVFVPLWFLGTYLAVSLLAPVTLRLHRAHRARVLVVLAMAILAADALRGRMGSDAPGFTVFAVVTSLVVWLFAHQLGYFWRDGTLTSAPRSTLWAIVGGALVALTVLTSFDAYPRSMVSLQGEGSNMFPTTACIAALAVLQLGLGLLVRPAALRWLQRRGPWMFTIAVNRLAMTVFTWHMTALVGAIGVYQLAGGELGTTATAAWWAQRPMWLILPGILLAGLVTVFARFERPTPAR